MESNDTVLLDVSPPLMAAGLRAMLLDLGVTLTEDPLCAGWILRLLTKGSAASLTQGIDDRKFLVVVSERSPNTRLALFEAHEGRVCASVTEDCTFRLAEAVDALRAGQSYIDQALVGWLLAAPPGKLSPEEVRLVQGLQDGASQKQIASDLEVSDKTVRAMQRVLKQRFSITGDLLTGLRQRGVL